MNPGNGGRKVSKLHTAHTRGYLLNRENDAEAAACLPDHIAEKVRRSGQHSSYDTIVNQVDSAGAHLPSDKQSQHPACGLAWN